jgi:hypothetical protein
MQLAPSFTTCIHQCEKSPMYFQLMKMTTPVWFCTYIIVRCCDTSHDHITKKTKIRFRTFIPHEIRACLHHITTWSKMYSFLNLNWYGNLKVSPISHWLSRICSWPPAGHLHFIWRFHCRRFTVRPPCARIHSPFRGFVVAP